MCWGRARVVGKCRLKPYYALQRNFGSEVKPGREAV